jgi:hypothetical protein
VPQKINKGWKNVYHTHRGLVELLSFGTIIACLIAAIGGYLIHDQRQQPEDKPRNYATGGWMLASGMIVTGIALAAGVIAYLDPNPTLNLFGNTSLTPNIGGGLSFNYNANRK